MWATPKWYFFKTHIVLIHCAANSFIWFFKEQYVVSLAHDDKEEYKMYYQYTPWMDWELMVSVLWSSITIWRAQLDALKTAISMRIIGLTESRITVSTQFDERTVAWKKFFHMQWLYEVHFICYKCHFILRLIGFEVGRVLRLRCRISGHFQLDLSQPKWLQLTIISCGFVIHLLWVSLGPLYMEAKDSMRNVDWSNYTECFMTIRTALTRQSALHGRVTCTTWRLFLVGDVARKW